MISSVSKSFSTPGVLKLIMACVIAAAASMALVCFVGVKASESSIDAIGRQAVPAIINAQQVRATLVEMDASATNEFLGGGAQARQRYDDARARLSKLLTTAASQPMARDAVEGIVEQVQVYAGLVETARSNNRQGFPVGSGYLRFASNLMHAQIMPAADALDKLNSEYLAERYVGQSRTHYLVLSGVVCAGLILLAALAFGQVFISRRMQRRFSPCLLVATVVVVGYLGLLVTALSLSDNRLSQASTGDFNALHQLWQARALAYDAKSDQSLYLVMRGNGQKYEQGFADKSNLLTAKIAESGAADQSPSFSDFVKVHESIRTMDKGGDRAKAVATATGAAAGQANDVFNTFDSAMKVELSGLKSRFDTHVDEASGMIAWMHLIAFLIAVCTIGLTWTGLRPRLNEYRI